MMQLMLVIVLDMAYQLIPFSDASNEYIGHQDFDLASCACAVLEGNMCRASLVD